MVHGKSVLQHRHLRKRLHAKGQKYPHPHPGVRFLDDLVLVVSAIIPLATLPQVFKIWLEQSAAGVSLWTWSLYLILSVPMLIYGFVHKDKPIILMYILWILIHISIIAGVMVYS